MRDGGGEDGGGEVADAEEEGGMSVEVGGTEGEEPAKEDCEGEGEPFND